MANTGAIHGDFYPSFEAEATITQFQAVKRGTSYNQMTPATAGDDVFGIAQSAVSANEYVSVKKWGFTLAKAGTGWRSAGDKLKSDANGDLVATTTLTDLVCGEAMSDDVSDDEYGEVYLYPHAAEYGSLNGA